MSVDTTTENEVYSVVVTDDPSRDWGNVLEIRHRGELIGSYCDHGEPEDNSFYRSYDWIAGELEKAFLLGRLAAVQETMKEVEELRSLVEECKVSEAPRAWPEGILTVRGHVDYEELKNFWENRAKALNDFNQIYMGGVVGAKDSGAASGHSETPPPAADVGKDQKA